MSTIITKRQFPNYRKYEMELAGRPLTLEVGKLAELANAAVMVGYGDTRVLVCATASARPRDGIDFFPLSVDFEARRACSPAGSLTGPSAPSSPTTSATTSPSWPPS